MSRRSPANENAIPGKLAQRQQDAVGRRAIYLNRTVGPPSDAQRPPERERVTGSALFPVGRHDRDACHGPADVGENL
jgi:hypothetical protein